MSRATQCIDYNDEDHIGAIVITVPQVKVLPKGCKGDQRKVREQKSLEISASHKWVGQQSSYEILLSIVINTHPKTPCSS